VEDVNTCQKRSMALKICDYFEAQGGVAGKTLALWGLAFKANTDDMREAASLAIIEELTSRGMSIQTYDPVAGANAKKLLADNKLVRVMEGQYEVLQGAQALLVVTEWNQFRTPDFERVRTMLTAPVLFDGRNLSSPSYLASQGFAYFCVGRRP
jgi:UDPglucose 6-dehydrogenase